MKHLILTLTAVVLLAGAAHAHPDAEIHGHDLVYVTQQAEAKRDDARARLDRIEADRQREAEKKVEKNK